MQQHSWHSAIGASGSGSHGSWKVCRGQRLRLRSDGVIEVEVTATSTIEIADARDSVEQIKLLAGQGPDRPVLIRLGRVLGITVEAREHYRDFTERTTSIAFVYEHPVAQALGAVAVALSRSAMPVRLFGNPDAALAWALERRQI